MATSKVKTVLPRGPDFVAYVNDVIVKNRLKGFDADLNLPSRRTRAMMMVHETTPFLVQDTDDSPNYPFSR